MQLLWTTGIDLNIFNAIKACIVFLFLKPLTVYATCVLAGIYATYTLHTRGELRLTSLGIFSSMFDGLIVPRTARHARLALVVPVLLLVTAWIGSISEVVFEYGIGAETERVKSMRRVRVPTSRNGARVAFTHGRNRMTDRVAAREMACDGLNGLESYVQVYTSASDGVETLCGSRVYQRHICAAGRDLINENCTIHALPNLLFRRRGDAYFPEHDMSFGFASAMWRVVSDDATDENGYVEFWPRVARYDERMLVQGVSESDGSRRLEGVERVYCGSGSRLNSVSLPGGMPFQVCLWKFKGSVIVTNAEWIVGLSTDGEAIYEGLSKSGQTVREFTRNYSELQISSSGRWISISLEEADGRDEISARDVMTTLSIGRELVQSSASNEDDHDGVETFEMGLWGSASMSLRVMERAVVLGIGMEDEWRISERSVFVDSRQIAVVDLRYLAQYIGSITVFLVFVLACRALVTYPLRLHVTVEGVLGWWALEKGGDTTGRGGNGIVLVSNERSMRVSVNHHKIADMADTYQDSIESGSVNSDIFT